MPCPQPTLGRFLGTCSICTKFERTVYVCLSSQLRVTLQEQRTVEMTVRDKRPAGRRAEGSEVAELLLRAPPARPAPGCSRRAARPRLPSSDRLPA